MKRLPFRRLIALLIALVLVAIGVGVVLGRGAPNGPAWQPAGLQGQLVHALAGEKGMVVAGAHLGVYRREGDGWRLLYRTPDVWSVTVAGRTVVAGDNAGDVLISRDGGQRWERYHLTGLGIYAVTAMPGRPSLLLAGGANGLFRSDDGGRHWRRTLKLPNSAGAAFTWDPGGEVVYAGAVAGAPGGSTWVYRSGDSGRTWRIAGHGLNSTGGIMSLLSVPADGLLAGTMGNAVWAVPGPAGRWNKDAPGMPPTGDHVAALVSAGHTLYAGTLAFGVFRRSGQKWVAMSAGLPASRAATTVTSLLPAGTTLLAGTADGVYSFPLRSATH